MGPVEFASRDKEFVSTLTKAGIEIGSVYDVGASNGYWSWGIATVVPDASFNLFEPLAGDQHCPDLAKVLQARPNFRLHRVALGDENTTLPMKVHEQSVASTLLDWDDHRYVVGREPVPVRRLDDLVAELDLPPADVIKIDTQGFELKVMQGGVACCRRAKALMLETWFYRGYGGTTPLLSEIIGWLSVRDFTLAGLGDVWVRPDMALMSIDAFFLRNDAMAQLASTSRSS